MYAHDNNLFQDHIDYSLIQALKDTSLCHYASAPPIMDIYLNTFKHQHSTDLFETSQFLKIKLPYQT